MINKHRFLVFIPNKYRVIYLVKILTLLNFIYTRQRMVLRAMLNGKWLCLCALFLILWGCNAPGLDISSVSWKTYSNSRYGFEFPYPSNWNSLTAPVNDDGIAIVSPRNNNVEIRAWASNQLPQSINQDSTKSTSPNFQTTQGLRGVLLVEVDNTVSSMTLTLTQNQVKYDWQGRSPSQEFSNYYPLFYYIAQQYRITQK